jgi:hypothetical protein
MVRMRVKVRNQIFPFSMILSLVDNPIEPSTGPKRSATRSRQARRMAESVSSSTVGRKQSKPKASSGSRRKANSAKSDEKALRRLRFWQKNYPPWYEVLQCLRKGEVPRELEDPWRSIGAEDSARWLLEAKLWYEKEHQAMKATGKMIAFFLRYVAYYLLLDKQPDPRVFIPQMQNWMHTRNIRVALRIAQSPLEAQQTFSAGIRLSPFDGFKNMVLARRFSKLNESGAVKQFLLARIVCFRLIPLIDINIGLYRESIERYWRCHFDPVYDGNPGM